MATSNNSFDSSPTGAFVRSREGARNSEALPGYVIIGANQFPGWQVSVAAFRKSDLSDYAHTLPAGFVPRFFDEENRIFGIVPVNFGSSGYFYAYQSDLKTYHISGGNVSTKIGQAPGQNYFYMRTSTQPYFRRFSRETGALVSEIGGVPQGGGPQTSFLAGTNEYVFGTYDNGMGQLMRLAYADGKITFPTPNLATFPGIQFAAGKMWAGALFAYNDAGLARFSLSGELERSYHRSEVPNMAGLDASGNIYIAPASGTLSKLSIEGDVLLTVSHRFTQPYFGACDATHLFCVMTGYENLQLRYYLTKWRLSDLSLEAERALSTPDAGVLVQQ